MIRMPPVSDAIIAATIAALVTALGHLLTRRTEREQTTLQVMQAQIAQLWDRVQQQDKRIDELSEDRRRERARSWAALEYARALRAWIDSVRLLLRDEKLPSVPQPPPELDAEL